MNEKAINQKRSENNLIQVEEDRRKAERQRQEIKENYLIEKENFDRKDKELRDFKPDITEEMKVIEHEITAINETVEQKYQEIASAGLFRPKLIIELLKMIIALYSSKMKKQALLEQLVEKQRKEKRNEIEEYKNEIVERILSPLLTGFGRYENDAVSNPIKPIEWIFLDRNGTRVLLISKHILAVKTFDSYFPLLSEEEKNSAFYSDPDKFIELMKQRMQNCKWESCVLRSWLNGAFIKKAFYPEEKELIEPKTGIFLLSIQEAEEYFPSDLERKCCLSEYHPRLRSNDAKDEWWLRSRGDRPELTAYVKADGAICYKGRDAFARPIGVRPALWIDLEKIC